MREVAKRLSGRSRRSDALRRRADEPSAVGLLGGGQARRRRATAPRSSPRWSGRSPSNPDHAAAIHLYIHAVEASSTPERARALRRPAARRRRRAAGHLVHMPAHIYCRVGRYRDSLDINRDAVAADEAHAGADRRGREPDLPLRLLPAQRPLPARLGADGRLGRRTRSPRPSKLGQVTSDEVAAKLGWVQAIKARALHGARPVQRARHDPGAAPIQATASRS